MPIAITLELTPDQDTTLPRDHGRAAYAAALARLAAVDAALAEQVHAGDGPKPLTCSPLSGARGDMQSLYLPAGRPVYLRITGLTEPVAGALAAGLLSDPPATWEIDRTPLPLTAVLCNEADDPWSGQASYEHMAARYLLAQSPPEPTLTLSFATPTAFTSGGMLQPLPLASLVFGSLVDRWNAFSPVALSPEARRFAEELVAISALNLRSRPVRYKQGMRVGSVGRVTYRALSRDRYWLAVLQLLGDFARFSGVGVQTTTGMGQVRRLARRSAADDPNSSQSQS